MSPDRRRWAALIVLCTGMLMIVLDLTVVNVALTGGYHLAFWVAAGLVAVSVAIAVFVLKPITEGDGTDALPLELVGTPGGRD